LKFSLARLRGGKFITELMILSNTLLSITAFLSRLKSKHLKIMKIKSIALAIAGFTLSSTAHAAWTANTPSGNGYVTGAFPSFTITGSNNWFGLYGITSYQNTFDVASTVSFDWSYSTNDSTSYYDPAGYAVGGIQTYLMNNGSRTGSGSETAEVSAGSTFSFFVVSNDSGGGSGFLGISNAKVSTATVPEPSAFALLGLGTVGLVARRRRVA
jgi:hypothetical protein